MAVKMQIIGDSFADLVHAIDRAGGDVMSAVDEALNETQRIVQEGLSVAAAPYANKGLKGYATGKMYNSIINDPSISWAGTVATVDVGFRLRNHGWHSIFVMYGTPRMAKDAKVYNAIKGTKVRKQIYEAQGKILENNLSLAKR